MSGCSCCHCLQLLPRPPLVLLLPWPGVVLLLVMEWR
jgi:hypothetical protein